MMMLWTPKLLIIGIAVNRMIDGLALSLKLSDADPL